MHKIPTIFDRDWDGNKGVVDAPVVPQDFLIAAIATEKLDGTNVRLTVRNHALVRIEKRRNPDTKQKAAGIVDPWYVDAVDGNPADRFIIEAARNTDLRAIADGEWSGEAVGPKFQGNPLLLGVHTVYLFTVPHIRQSLMLTDVPTTFAALREWLPQQRSLINPDAPIEGIVWHHPDGRMAKIKGADFK